VLSESITALSLVALSEEETMSVRSGEASLAALRLGQRTIERIALRRVDLAGASAHGLAVFLEEALQFRHALAFEQSRVNRGRGNRVAAGQGRGHGRDEPRRRFHKAVAFELLPLQGNLQQHRADDSAVDQRLVLQSTGRQIHLDFPPGLVRVENLDEHARLTQPHGVSGCENEQNRIPPVHTDAHFLLQAFLEPLRAAREIGAFLACSAENRELLG
jgi:hypothetical protein